MRRKNKTRTLPTVGPFSKTKPPQRCINKHAPVTCGQRPGDRRVVLAPAEVVYGLGGFPGLYV